jgi:integrase
MASIFLRGNTYWIAYSTPGGKRIRKSLDIKKSKEGLREAQRLCQHYEAILKVSPEKLSQQRVVDRGGIRLSELLKKYLLAEGGDRSPKTRYGYDLALRHFELYWGDPVLRNITQEMLFEFKRGEIKRAKEFNTSRDLSCLRRLFNWAVDNDYLMRTPLRKGIMFNPPPPPIKTFKEFEVNAIIDKARADDPDLANVLDFLNLSGFRVGEVLKAERKNVDLENCCIWILNQKEHRWEAFPLDDVLVEHFKSLPIRKDGYIYKYRAVSTINHYTRPYINEVCEDKKLNIHTFKKTYVTRLVRAGLPATVVHKLAHHKNIDTTMKYYAQFSNEQLTEGLAASRVSADRERALQILNRMNSAELLQSLPGSIPYTISTQSAQKSVS